METRRGSKLDHATTSCLSTRHHKRKGTIIRQKAAVASFLAIYSSGSFVHVAAFPSSTTASTTRRQAVGSSSSQTIAHNDTLDAVKHNIQQANRPASKGSRTIPVVAEWQDLVGMNKGVPLLDENWFSSESYRTETKTSYKEHVDDASQHLSSKFEMKQPFFAERISKVMAYGNFPLNGNTLLNGKNGVHVGIIPLKEVNGKIAETHVDLPIVNATTRLSRVRRAICAVQGVWGHVSPIRLFSSAHEDAASSPVEVVSESPQPVVSAESSKKQRKEEAILARMSQRKKKQLSELLKSVNRQNTKSMAGITSRTLTGLITALAEEAEGVSVRMMAREDTPIWRKQIDTVSIEFTRLGFKPLHMGGPDQQLVVPEVEVSKNKSRQQETPATPPPPELQQDTVEEGHDDECPVKFILDPEGNPIADISCADNAFNQMDVDNSGALDKDEIADALVIAASASSAASALQPDEMDTEVEGSNRKIIQKLAKQLVDLYDTNDDGVIDRTEYQSMVEDMAALRQVQKEREEKENKNPFTTDSLGQLWGWALGSVLRGNKESEEQAESGGDEIAGEALVETLPEATGKIVLEGLKIDLRQLVFGAIPLLRHVSDSFLSCLVVIYKISYLISIPPDNAGRTVVSGTLEGHRQRFLQCG
jgi:EF-hand domain pair